MFDKAKAKQEEQRKVCRQAEEAAAAAKKQAEEAAKQQEEDDLQVLKAKEKCDLLDRQAQEKEAEKETGFVDEGEDSYVKSKMLQYIKLLRNDIDPSCQQYKLAALAFKEDYKTTKSAAAAMDVDSSAAETRKAGDTLAEAEAKAKRQRQADEEAAAASTSATAAA